MTFTQCIMACAALLEPEEEFVVERVEPRKGGPQRPADEREHVRLVHAFGPEGPAIAQGKGDRIETAYRHLALRLLKLVHARSESLRAEADAQTAKRKSLLEQASVAEAEAARLKRQADELLAQQEKWLSSVAVRRW